MDKANCETPKGDLDLILEELENINENNSYTLNVIEDRLNRIQVYPEPCESGLKCASLEAVQSSTLVEKLRNQLDRLRAHSTRLNGINSQLSNIIS